MFYSNVASESATPYFDIGQSATDALFANSRVLRRDCPGCSNSLSKTIYYKRISPIPTVGPFITTLWNYGPLLIMFLGLIFTCILPFQIF